MTCVFLPAALSLVPAPLWSQTATSPQNPMVVTTLDEGIPPCTDSTSSTPQLTCTVVVENPELGLFAQVKGPKACVQAINLGGGFENFVVRYLIAEEDQDKFRFSGTETECPVPVTEAPTCDYSGGPFLGLSCQQVNTENQTLVCPACAVSRQPLCYTALSETSVDLKVSNVNFCPSGQNTFISYMIAVKSKQVVTVDGQEYRRLYLVDPTVIQEPNCPGGIC